MATEPDAYFGLVEIEGKTCAVCGQEPVAAYPIRMRPEDFERELGVEALARAIDEGGRQPDGAIVGTWWFCQEHVADAVSGGMPVQEVRRTCLQMVGETQCGAAATHMAILGVKGHGLQLVSVCPKHLRGHKPDQD
jgi:hypothetical protein